MIEKNKHKTVVIFRKYINPDPDLYPPEILALFPYVKEYNGFVLVYQHIGQHGACDYNHCISITKPATKAEYTSLYNELSGIGYNLLVRKRKNGQPRKTTS